MKKLFLAAAICIFATINTHAVTTLQFTVPATGVAGGFANSSGVQTNGMLWGVIVSTTNNTFGSGSYDPFDVTAGSQFLTISGVATDDYFVYKPALATVNAPNETGVGGVTSTGAGAITNINTVPFGTNGIDGADHFGIIWFQSGVASSGSSYGFFTDAASPNFLVNGDGVQNKAAYFNGADTNKPASLTFGAVPEPSRASFMAMALLGLLMRRKR